MNEYPAPYAVPTGGQLRIVFASVMVGVAVVALCACGLLGWKLFHDGPIAATQHRVHELREQGRTAAELVTVTVTSIDSGNVDESFAKILELSTGELRDQFAKGSVQLRQLLIDNHATATGTVIASAVQSDTLDTPEKKVVVLLMVDQAITNSQLPDPRIDKSRMKVTMELVDGRWLASRLEYV
ncbi:MULTISPECIES: hypothetical protein [Mycobacteroides]|uniref:hypothetical protein n=1 Tax=Mycobacteroides TaxID=670516 RepID=UPI000715E109|nr:MULTISPECIES: hypothetical protein [Mycobacteroides]KRQ22364.1 hypothetical protein AOT87_14700 [Mycobacteroides sp. H003]KRQ27627.1 hypothetical protein AOT91_19070 [Mycobacteroides sp. H092]KRQ40813.1 hypothetical protein AOT92_14320 [Mycobacteroides sp. H101]KRQ42507.1 hypothetical protein AOT88_27760 [Mycobacteroides sp. H063]KRQ54743.1 hypothetical protein AOT94_25025 [Mycobacteroides sp. HXVII]